MSQVVTPPLHSQVASFGSVFGGADQLRDTFRFQDTPALSMSHLSPHDAVQAIRQVRRVIVHVTDKLIQAVFAARASNGVLALLLTPMPSSSYLTLIASTLLDAGVGGPGGQAESCIELIIVIHSSDASSSTIPAQLLSLAVHLVHLPPSPIATQAPAAPVPKVSPSHQESSGNSVDEVWGQLLALIKGSGAGRGWGWAEIKSRLGLQNDALLETLKGKSGDAVWMKESGEVVWWGVGGGYVDQESGSGLELTECITEQMETSSMWAPRFSHSPLVLLLTISVCLSLPVISGSV